MVERKTSRLRALTILALAFLLSSAVSTPAAASNFSTPGWADPFTSTISSSVLQNGDLNLTAVFTDTVGADLVSSTATSGQLMRVGHGFRICPDNTPIPPASTGLPPQGCMLPILPFFFGGPVLSSSPERMEVSVTIPASTLALYPATHQCVAIRSLWRDSSSTLRVFTSPFVEFPGATSCTPPSSASAPSASPQIGTVSQSISPVTLKYSGPEFLDLHAKPFVDGSRATLMGRKLDFIDSISLAGRQAVLLEVSSSSIKIQLPTGLNVGLHHIVAISSDHGKLTHMNAIRIREELPATSLTIKGTGVLSGEEFKKLTAFSRTQNPDMNTVTCIVNSNSEGKSFMQARALCDRIAANNLNIKTTMFETRSTVEGSAIFARVVFSSEE